MPKMRESYQSQGEEMPSLRSWRLGKAAADYDDSGL